MHFQFCLFLFFCMITHTIPLVTGRSMSEPMVAPYVDLVKYTEYPWYEIASIEQRFEKQCVKVQAEYILQQNGNIKVNNYCLKENGREKIAYANAYLPDSNVTSKLKVSFFWPFYADYWILYVDENYKYALVGDRHRKTLWILSRYISISDTMYERLLIIAKARGYDVSQLRVLPDAVYEY